EKVSMQILEDEREARLAAVAVRMRLAHGARRRIEKERTVVGLAVVVAGGAKAQRRPQDQDRRRERPPMRLDERRIKRREVWTPLIIGALKGSPGGVNSKRAENQDRRNQLKPPRVATHRRAEATAHNCASRSGHRFARL